MTRNELIDKYWLDFLVWCTNAPEGKAHELVFWIDHHYPTEENFWEYMVNVRADDLNHQRTNDLTARSSTPSLRPCLTRWTI